MRTALFSVSYAGFWGQHRLDAAGCIYKAAKLGYDGILFMAKRPHLDPLLVTEKELQSIEAALKETGLTAAGLAAYTDFTLPAPGEIPVRDFQLGYIRACCRIASRLGGEIVRIFTGYRYPDTGEQAAWNTVVTALRECGDAAREYGVRIAVQNHHDIAVGTEEMELLLDEVGHPQVGAGYDAWSPYLRGEDIAAGAARMAPKTLMSIAANYRKYPRYQYHPDQVNYSRVYPDSVRATTINSGEIDYRQFFSALKEGGFTGWAVYEMCSPLTGGGSEENLDRHAAAFVSFMKGLEAEQ